MRQSKMLAVSSLALLVAACGGGSNDDTANKNTNTLPVVVTTKDVAIQFAAQANGADVKCGTVNTMTNLGLTKKTAQLQDLRFYISEVNLINSKGEAVPVTLKNNDFQNYGVALLDFEDATGACENDKTGSAETNNLVLGKINEGNYTGIQFLLGVPDTGLDNAGKTVLLNHSDVMIMQKPLDIMAMGWFWQAGRRFLKIELKPEGGVTNQNDTLDNTADDTTAIDGAWPIHLGASNCVDNGIAVSELQRFQCTNLNTPTIKLTNFDTTKQKIVLDLSALLANSNISVNQNNAVGCMSHPDDKECPAIFAALGIDLATGKTSTSKTQTMFKVVNK